MGRIICIGEAIVDMIPGTRGVPLKDVVTFRRACGGAPANCAAAAARLGAETSLLTCVGQDGFGDYLLASLAAAGVDVSHAARTANARTTLAFVTLGTDGNREFAFYRNPGADLLLCETDIHPNSFERCGFLHFGSVDLVEAPVKYAHKKAISLAKAQNAVISFDPNIRLALWDSPETCLKTVRAFLHKVDILKVSDEELAFLTSISGEDAALAQLFDDGAQLVLYSMGERGARLLTRQQEVFCPAPEVSVADTTGAGDAGMGALLYCLWREDITKDTLTSLSAAQLAQILQFSVAYASSSVTRQGALPSYCNLSETLQFIHERMQD